MKINELLIEFYEHQYKQKQPGGPGKGDAPDLAHALLNRHFFVYWCSNAVQPLFFGGFV